MKKRKKKTGPKPNPEKARSKGVRIRFNRGELAEILAGAKSAGQPAAAFIRESALFMARGMGNRK